MSIDKPSNAETGKEMATDVEREQYKKAVDLFKIACDMFDKLQECFEQHPESSKRAPELAYTANKIIGEYYRKSALFLGIPEYIINDAENDDNPEKQSKNYWD